ncbi:hypothetical protein LBMAG42_57140 [Deltaproteobacteria bacterium]|nr:hypothetical protein LBMAG42_57140 [Deltaproteobacteria bacterium]
MIFLVAVAAAVAFAGSVVAAGPVGAMVLRAGFEGAPHRGVVLGGGAALAQGGYAALALVGAANLVAENAAWVRGIHLVSGCFFLGFAVFVWQRAPSPPVAAPSRRGRDFGWGFFTTLFNPAPLLSWATLTTILAAEGRIVPGASAATGFAIGAGVGAFAAFAVVAFGAARLHERGGAAWSQRVLRGAAVLLVLLSVDSFVEAAAG